MKHSSEQRRSLVTSVEGFPVKLSRACVHGDDIFDDRINPWSHGNTSWQRGDSERCSEAKASPRRQQSELTANKEHQGSWCHGAQPYKRGLRLRTQRQFDLERGSGQYLDGVLGLELLTVTMI